MSFHTYQRHEVVPLVRPEDGERLAILVGMPQTSRLDDGPVDHEFKSDAKIKLIAATSDSEQPCSPRDEIEPLKSLGEKLSSPGHSHHFLLA